MTSGTNEYVLYTLAQVAITFAGFSGTSAMSVTVKAVLNYIGPLLSVIEGCRVPLFEIG
jgi:hypothetical protein